MIVLGLDSATPALSIALVDVATGRVLAGRTSPPGVNHGELLPEWVAEVLAEAGLRLADLAGLAVGTGPGAFTGLRVSLATAKGLSYGARIPLAGASSLAAMALEARERAGPDTTLVPLLDARKGEVYAGFYRPEGDGVRSVAPEVALPPQALRARLGAGDLVFGPGALAYPGELPVAVGLPVTPSAAHVARLAAPRLGGYDPALTIALEPTYLRQSDRDLSLGPPRPV